MEIYRGFFLGRGSSTHGERGGEYLKGGAQGNKRVRKLGARELNKRSKGKRQEGKGGESEMKI